jgi:hypothetical protein
MARLPNLPMRRFAEGGATTEDIPATQGGAGTFPMEEKAPVVDDLKGNRPRAAKQKVGLTEGEKVTPTNLTSGTNEFLTTTGTDLGTAPSTT